MTDAETLIEKMRSLPAHRPSDVEDFVDFLRDRERERAITRAAAAASVPAFAAIRDDPDDAVCDAL